ncbi:MAG: SurA N-terminal domain-containing protein [Muribaculaceae bacterium]
MAALEKIRSKAVFLTVIIGVALLAFILGDFLTSGRTFFGDGNTIAKVGDEKIDAMELQRRYEKMSAQLQERGQNMDGAVIQNQVLNQMISEILLNNELEALGIYVTDEELTDAMTGKNARPQVVQFARQLGAETPDQLHDMLFNPGKYGIPEEQVLKARESWIEMETDMERNMKYEKLQNLIAGALQANDLDKKELWEENATVNTINFVKQDFASLSDSEYPVSDAEIKAAYNKDKSQFRLDTEMRQAHIIAVDIAPSTVDLNAAKDMIDSTYAALLDNVGVDAVRNNSDLIINEAKVRASDIRDTEIKNFITAAQVGAVTTPKFASNVYTIVKLNGKKMEVDSVKLNMMVVEGDKKLQDSIYAMLNAGKSFAEIQKNKAAQGQEGVWQVLTQAPDSLKNKFFNAGESYFALQQSAEGAYFCKVVEKVAPKMIYDIANISYTVYPSTKTIEDLSNGLQNFINTNNTTELFVANAAKAGYNAIPVSVTAEDPQINNIEGSRKNVKWLFDANEGSVSPIEKLSDKMVTVALDKIHKKGYMGVDADEVKTALTIKVRNEKKADALIAKYKGKAKDMNGYAALMNAKVDTTQVTFGQMFIAKIGVGESDLTARVATAKLNAIEGPVKGNNGVYVFQVVKQDRTERTAAPEESERQFASTRGSQAVMSNALQILRNATTVDNKMIKFF